MKTIFIMDLDEEFQIYFTKKKVPIKYGMFALAFANIEYEMMITIIEEYIDKITRPFEIATTLGYIQDTHPESVKKYKQYGISPNAVKSEVVKEITTTLYKPIYNCLDNGYLNKQQLQLVTHLVLLELKNNIASDSFNWQDASTYIPSILIHKNLKEQITSILKRNHNSFSVYMQKLMSQITITSSIDIDRNGITRTVYHINNTLSFLMVDLQKYLEGKKTVSECKRCGKLFYPSSGKNKKYCRLPHASTKLTCAELEHREPSNIFADVCKKARGTQQGFYNNALRFKDNPHSKYQYDFDELYKTYALWTQDCSDKYEYYKGINDLDGFVNWINNTKFTVENLERMGIRTLHPNDK